MASDRRRKKPREVPRPTRLKQDEHRHERSTPGVHTTGDGVVVTGASALASFVTARAAMQGASPVDVALHLQETVGGAGQ